jgi:hypothetical protein
MLDLATLHHLRPSPRKHQHRPSPLSRPSLARRSVCPRRGPCLGLTSLASRCLLLRKNQIFRPAPTRPMTMAASLDPGYDSPSSRAILCRAKKSTHMPRHQLRESTCRQPSIGGNSVTRGYDGTQLEDSERKRQFQMLHGQVLARHQELGPRQRDRLFTFDYRKRTRL